MIRDIVLCHADGPEESFITDLEINLSFANRCQNHVLVPILVFSLYLYYNNMILASCEMDVP